MRKGTSERGRGLSPLALGRGEEEGEVSYAQRRSWEARRGSV